MAKTETKTAKLMIRTTPRLKALAERLAKSDKRSLSSYIERLIERDANDRKS